MNDKICLTEDQIYELFYSEEETDKDRSWKLHMENCPICSAKWREISQFLTKLDLPVPNGGDRAVKAASGFLGLTMKPFKAASAESNEIMTMEDVAVHLKVSVDNVENMLHEIPHFIFDGNIRIRRPALEKFIRDLEKRSADQTTENVHSLRLRKEII